MSREFGEYNAHGYFHGKLRSCAEDTLASKYELTLLTGELLNELTEVAYHISNYEAYNDTYAQGVFECIKRLPQIEDKLNNIKSYLTKYEEVIKLAIKEKEHVEIK